MSIRQVFILCIFVLLTATHAEAQSGPPPAGAPVTCALVADSALDLPDSAAFALLTAELSKQPALDLLERAEVGRVLQERALQLALAAEGLEARRALGTLLKARLLILLRAGEKTVNAKKIRFVDLAISETASGLRLVQDELVWDEAVPAALGSPVAADAAQALARLAEPATAIVAVPPFLSDDLEHRYDAMQEAYPRLLTGALAATPGLRLVELAEAQAVADEIRLTDGAKISRALLPYYLQGRYRNDARDGRSSPTVTLALELRRGEQALGAQKSAPLDAAAAGDFLRAGAQALLSPILKTKPAPFDPDVEIAALQRQARQFEQLGEYEKALTLTEAALLLQPGAPELLKYAIDLTTELLNELDAKIYHDPNPPAARYDAAIERAIGLDRRALDHLALYLRSLDLAGYVGFQLSHLGQRPLGDKDDRKYLQAGGRMYRLKSHDPRLGPLINELGQAKRETIVAFFEFLAERPQVKTLKYSQNPLQSLEILPGEALAIQEPAAATRQTLMRLVHALWKYDKGLDVWAIAALACVTLPDAAEDEAFLAEIAALPGRQCALIAQYARLRRQPLTPIARLKSLNRLIGETSGTMMDNNVKYDLRDLLTQEGHALSSALKAPRIKARQDAAQALGEKAIANAAAGLLAPGDDPALDPFRAYALKMKKGGQVASPAQANSRPTTATAEKDYVLEPIRNAELARQKLLGWIEAGNGYDLIWSDRSVYVLSPAGQLKPILLSPTPALRLSISGGTVREEDSGLESSIKDVAFDGRWAWVPLKDCLVVVDPIRGTMQKIDSTNGLPPGEMAVAPLGPGRVCVVGGFGRGWCASLAYEEPGHVSIDVFHEARLVRGEWNDPGVAFKPRFAATFRGTDGRPRVLVGRQMEGRGQFHPLLLDPGRRTVEVVPQRISGQLQNSSITARDGMLYWVAQSDDVVLKNAPFYPPGNLPGARLESWDASGARVQVLFNNVPVPVLQSSRRPLRDLAATTFMADILQGQMYVFARDCWALDRAGGRLVQLRGEGLNALGLWRLGHSSRLGTVFLSPSRDGICGYVFRPRAPVAAAAGHTIVERDPLEGTEIVLRSYPPGTTTDYTTLTTQIRAGVVPLEWQEATTSTMLALLGQDQPVPWVREALADRITLYGGGMLLSKMRRVRDECALDSFPFTFALRHRAAAQPWVFADARGKPIPGAQVRVIYHNLDRDMLSPDSAEKVRFDFSVDIQGSQTDGAGRVSLNVPEAPAYGYLEFRVSQPDYGTASCPMIWMGGLLGTGSRQLGAGGMVKTPLVRRGSPESLRALRGRLVDERGQGAGGRLVTAFLKENAAAQGWPTLEHLERAPSGVLSQGDGSFSLYPVSGADGTTQLPKNTALRVRVSDPEHPDLARREAWLDNAREQTIAVPGPVARAATPPGQTPGGSGTHAPRPKVSAGAAAVSGPRDSATTPLIAAFRPGFTDVPVAITLLPARPAVTPPPPDDGARELDDESLIEQRYEGELVDALSGKPMAGAYLVTEDYIEGATPQFKFMASQWRMLHDYHGPLTGENEALLLLRAAQGGWDPKITRTDAAGHFTLARNHWDRISEVTALEENYLPGSLKVGYQANVTSGTITILPLIKLYPAGAAPAATSATVAQQLKPPAPETPYDSRLAERGDAALKYIAARQYAFSPQVAEARTSVAQCLARLNASSAPRPAWAVGRSAVAAPAPAEAAPAEDPDFEQADVFYAQQKWTEARESLTRYAASHPGSTRLQEAQLKSLFCLYWMRQYEPFHLETQLYLEQKHPAPASPLFQSLAFHLALAAQQQKLRCQALQDFKNYIDAFPEGEDILPAMRERSTLALALAQGFMPANMPDSGETNKPMNQAHIPFRVLQGDAAKLADQGRANLREYRARLLAAREGAEASKRKELDGWIAEAAALEKNNEDMFQINWQISARLKHLITARWAVYLLIPFLAALILLRRLRRRKSDG